MIGGIVALLAITGALEWLLYRRLPDLAVGSILIIVVLGVYALYVRLTERRAVAELAPRALLPETLLGVIIGAVLFCAVIGLLAFTGHYTFLGYASIPDLITTIVLTLLGAIAEELLFRGFIFRVVQAIGGTWIAVGISAIIFGALHGLNHGATITSSIAIAVEAGVLLALAYTATNRLWLPIGLHFGWNFTEGSIFGVSVSGHQALPSLIRGNLAGPDYLTGGTFGVEASILAVVVCSIASVLFAIYIIRTKRIVPIPSRQTSAPLFRQDPYKH